MLDVWRWVLARSARRRLYHRCRVPDANVFECWQVRLNKLVRFQFASTLGRDVGRPRQVSQSPRLPGHE